ncbi:hypothetical protein ACFQGB_05795 [Halorubellus litoreus]|uniref:Rubredoxin-like domain-containing protein n=1 Tax=Halorubellus litoreus TaxID=755308 RepID=A0ABD5VFB3_9EURY
MTTYTCSYCNQSVDEYSKPSTCPNCEKSGTMSEDEGGLIG